MGFILAGVRRGNQRSEGAERDRAFRGLRRGKRGPRKRANSCAWESRNQRPSLLGLKPVCPELKEEGLGTWTRVLEEEGVGS